MKTIISSRRAELAIIATLVAAFFLKDSSSHGELQPSTSNPESGLFQMEVVEGKSYVYDRIYLINTRTGQIVRHCQYLLEDEDGNIKQDERGKLMQTVGWKSLAPPPTE